MVREALVCSPDEEGNQTEGQLVSSMSIQVLNLTIFASHLAQKMVLLGETGKEKLLHYYKNIGLGFKTVKKAMEGT
ncbi:hypothetical protein Celaphus_00014994 [Cervus elaphus hippelaphus]|uniref:Uncharacterized protein n=1 Tax=Cervus elaphus hippelaphus TaxID=46360 RepID=A0A212D434_CEREH|nr:hypothetical protein Celaphus_00014994 [Cervus elaphus hippelaphus]